MSWLFARRATASRRWLTASPCATVESAAFEEVDEEELDEEEEEELDDEEEEELDEEEEELDEEEEDKSMISPAPSTVAGP